MEWDRSVCGRAGLCRLRSDDDGKKVKAEPRSGRQEPWPRQQQPRRCEDPRDRAERPQGYFRDGGEDGPRDSAAAVKRRPRGRVGTTSGVRGVGTEGPGEAPAAVTHGLVRALLRRQPEEEEPRFTLPGVSGRGPARDTGGPWSSMNPRGWANSETDCPSSLGALFLQD